MSEQDMLAALREGALLVTVNNRLARHWRKRFADAAAATSKVWPAPDILPWGVWLQRMWDEASFLATDAPLLLDARQAARVWQGIIDADDLALLQSGGSARLAQEAWSLMQDWRLSPPFDPLESNDDVLHFQRWAQRFEATCQHEGWLDEARLPAQLLKALAAGRIQPPARIILLGFEDWRPQHRALLDALSLRGASIDILPLFAAADVTQAQRLALPDAASEDEAAARWVRALLDAHPDRRIAIIAPDLQDRRASLSRLLDAQLAPRILLPGGGEDPRPWNLSLGTPLRDQGMVRAAFHIFELGDARLDLDTLGQALRSPFIAGFEQEADARALLDLRLRTRGERRVSREYARRRAAEGDCPAMGRLLARLQARRQEQPSRQSPAGWASALRDELKLAGWPGDASLSSAAFQLRQAWLDTLKSMARLELVQPGMTRSEALAQLRGMASDTLFQPEAITDAPVQVLGPLEAIGLRFDAVWLLGMHSDQWPPDARPNPFLPMRLQARLGLPHASPARELDYLRRVSARLLELAPEVIVSHPRQAGGQELEPSPLFAQLPWLDGMPAQSELPMPMQWGNTALMDTVMDAVAPALDEGVMAPGGARVLELQSACPFRAFVELRLKAQPLEEPDLGPDARVRGTVLHALLERVWGALDDQDALEAMDDDAIASLVTRHAIAVVDDEARQHLSLWPERLKALEVERLSALALDWLAVERERPPFTVEARELQKGIEIGGLRLGVKLDRVDRLEGGGRMIIDYKTGRASVRDWHGERPAAPQLPLYALMSEDARAIAFAQVRAGEMALKGVLDHGEGWEALKGMQPAEPSWPEVLAGYRSALERLARDFRAGHAAVDPRDRSVCTHCPLGMVCRIHEQAGLEYALEEVKDDE